VKDIVNMLQLIFAVIGGYIGYFLGGWDGFLYALIAFVAIDYLTGVMVAVLEKRLSSEVGARGIFKKVLIFALVAVAHIVDAEFIKAGSAIRTAVIFFYLSNEGISILENTAKIGLPIPEKLKMVLEQLNKEDSGNE
jgi:toxin secretion/phage lysis holin